MPDLVERFTGGLVTSRDPADLRPGELQNAEGAYYKVGDRAAIHKEKGRTLFGATTSGGKVKGLYLAKFDTADDQLLALAGTTLDNATAGKTGTFSSLITGLSSSATRLDGAHYNDRHYLVNGFDTNRVLESDLSTRLMGMQAPNVAPTATITGPAAVVARPTADDAGFTNTGFGGSGDTDLLTYASGTLSAAGTVSATWTTWASTAVAGRKVFVKWALAGIQDPGAKLQDRVADAGGKIDEGFDVNVKFEISTDAGSTFTTIADQMYTSSVPESMFQKPVSVDSDQVQFRATLTYNSGQKAATLRIYDVRIQSASPTTVFSTESGGLSYAFTEYDQTRGIESPASSTLLVNLTSQNQVALALPSSTQNTNTTHWRIYRTTDGGVAPADLGLIGQIESSETEFIDDFTVYAYTIQARPLYALLTISVADGKVRVDQNSPPPKLRKISAFKGSLVGLSEDNRRALYYSIPGLPESWPTIYVIDAFPLPENDQLVDFVTLGDSLIVAAKEVLLRLDELPRVIQGVFNASEAAPIQGAPGLASDYGLAAFTVFGAPRVAWISNYGVYVTDGHTVQRISDDLDWDDFVDLDKSNWVLHWDRNKFTLVMAFNATGGANNNRHHLFHMHPSHSKDVDGIPSPLITGATFSKINHMVSGHVGSSYRRYSAHVSDGNVYLENSGGTDASNALDSSGTLRMTLKGRRVYADGFDWSALEVALRHSDFGTNQTMTLDWTVGDDEDEYEETISQSVAVNGSRKSYVDIGVGGEHHEYTLTHTGRGLGKINEFTTQVGALGSSGLVKSG